MTVVDQLELRVAGLEAELLALARHANSLEDEAQDLRRRQQQQQQQQQAGELGLEAAAARQRQQQAEEDDEEEEEEEEEEEWSHGRSLPAKPPSRLDMDLTGATITSWKAGRGGAAATARP